MSTIRFHQETTLTPEHALVELRRFVIEFSERVEPGTPQVWQWERNIEL